MITSNRRVLFGGKVAVVVMDDQTVTISTAKEGLFKKLSTVIYEDTSEGRRPFAKLIYTPSLFNTDRRTMHDVIAKTIDEQLSDDVPIDDIIRQLIEELRGKGLIAEAINLNA